MENLDRKVLQFAGGLVLFSGLTISYCDDKLVAEREVVLAEAEVEKCVYSRLIYHFKIKESGCGAEYTDHSYRLDVYDCGWDDIKADLGAYLHGSVTVNIKSGKKITVTKSINGYEIHSPTPKSINNPLCRWLNCNKLKNDLF